MLDWQQYRSKANALTLPLLYFFLDNHLIMLDFCGIVACTKAKIIDIILCNGVRFIGGKLFGSIACGNQK